MIERKHWKRYYEDNLVIRVLTKDGQMISQGKRLPNKAFDHVRRAQKVYVKKDVIAAVKLIKEETGAPLKECLATFNRLRGITLKERRWKEA